MQQSLLFLILQLALTPIYGQLIDHYRFEQNGKTLSLQEQMDAEGVPAFSTYLIYGGQQDSLTVGVLKKGGQKTVAHSTPFPVGAMSEAPVLFEVLRLADAGGISLEDPLEKYLPELEDKRWLKFGVVTIRDLMLRRKSFGGPMKPTGYVADEAWPELNELLKTGSLDFPRGLAIRSNWRRKQKPQCANAILLQLILERYYKQPLPEIMAERVLGPLGMKHSYYATELTDAQEQGIALGHDQWGATQPGGYRRYPELAAMGLWTTPADYALFVQHIIRAARGEDNRFLKPETARAGLTRQLGYRSLLFHINEDGLIYWGGNAKGYFTAMQANLEEDYIMVAFCNGNLNWPLVMSSLYQSGGWIAKQRKGESLVIFTQPGDEALSAELRRRLIIYARENEISFMEKDASRGAPASITATPALMFQSLQGYTVFGGKVTEWSAIENFIRAARSRLVVLEAAVTGPILVRREGRQTLGFPLKWTRWQGETPAEDWEVAFISKLKRSLGANYEATAGFFPTDRRYYLDVHPYAKGDSVFLSLAVFSQYDCIHTVFDNFGRPLAGTVADKEMLLNRAAEIFAQAVYERRSNVQFGDALFTLSANTVAMDFETLGLPIPKMKAKRSFKGITAHTLGSSERWSRLQALREGQPLLQFNFPSPLERYAGEVRQLNGNLIYTKGQLSGEFVAVLNSLTMGMAELDAKVLKEYLKVRRYARASFTFKEQPMVLQWDRVHIARIAGNFHFLGKDIPLMVDARLQPRSEHGSVDVQVQFELNIANPFGLPGPDGPEGPRERLQFSLQFLMAG